MKLAIVTACSADWVPMACATLLSCARNRSTAAQNFIIAPEGAKADCTRLIETASVLAGEPISFIEFDRKIVSDLNYGFFNEANVYRLMMDKLIDRSFDRVLYLDSDVLAIKSIDDLLTCDIGNHCAGAVADFALLPGFSSTRSVEKRASIGFDTHQKYFNSGVLLLSWKEVLATKVFCNARELLRKHNFEFADQDALNIALSGRWKELDPRYNVQAPGRDIIEPNIVHFTRKPKPWSSPYLDKDLAFHKMYLAVFNELGVDIAKRHWTSSALTVSRTALENLRLFLRPSRRKRLKQKAERRQRASEDFDLEIQRLVPALEKYAQNFPCAALTKHEFDS